MEGEFDMVRIGIIGAGNIALRHLEDCRIMDDVSVAAICDLNQTPAHHGTEIMRILNSIYKSAETGNEIVFSE